MAEDQHIAVLTDQQREVLKLHQEGNSIRKIASMLGVYPNAVRKHLQAAERKLQDQEQIAQLIEEVPGAPNKTVNELRVLALVGKGMTVKQAAAHLNKSETSVRLTLYRNDISAKDFSRKELTPQEKERYSQIKSPLEEELEKLKDGFLLSVLRTCEAEGVPSAELEVVLRAAGFIHRTPRINSNNRAVLNILRAQSRDDQLVFILSSIEIRIIRKELQKCGINRGLDYFGAKLIYVEKGVPEEEPSHIYVTTRSGWENIQKTIRTGLEMAS